MMKLSLRHRSRGRQRGMQLLEVLISVLIFSVGLLGMVALYARTIQVSMMAEDRTRAALLADELVNTMWTSGTLNLPAPVIAAWQAKVADAVGPPSSMLVTSRVTNSHLPNGAGSVSVDAATSTATITITWQAPGATQASRLQTQVSM